MNSIPTFIINLKSRPERKKNVLKEFEGREEFEITIVEGIQHRNGLIGLWQTMKHIIKDLVNEKDEIILICQDDHQFTANYTFNRLKKSIDEAVNLNADILLGGVSWFQTAFQSSQNLYWTEKFSGLQFALIFKKFFNPLFNLELNDFDAGDYCISAFTDKKWIIYPYISTQIDYGYSDVTVKNNKPERQQELFHQSNGAMEVLNTIHSYFKNQSGATDLATMRIDDDAVTIPTFIINLPERKDRRAHIKNQFQGYKEFSTTFVNAIKDSIGAVGLWKSIRSIILQAAQTDEDLIIICEDDHTFTSSYSKKDFLSGLIKAHEMNADILIGGTTGGMNHILPVANNLFWVDSFWGTQFIVIYKKLFPAIINEPFNEQVTADGLLSEIAVNKLVYYPFISTQKDFGYSDITGGAHKNHPVMYAQTVERIERVHRNYRAYNSMANRIPRLNTT